MSKFERNGIRSIGFDLNDAAISELNRDWKNHITTISPYPGSFSGAGIVICAGGFNYFTCCWVAINALRHIGCQLPIQVWYVGNELSEEAKGTLEEFEVTCHNVMDYWPVSISGWMLKSLSILKSSFKEILFLDADNVCFNNPEGLFSCKEYLEFGAIFWPDYWKTAIENPIWEITESYDFGMKEQESGQILIDKEKCWKELNLCFYFNQRSAIYYKLLHGDKDTFRFAWQALKKKFHMIETEVASCGYLNSSGNFLGTTMVQHNAQGIPYFLHRNLLKWDVTQPGEKVWKKVKRFSLNAKIKEYNINLSESGGHLYIDLTGDVEETDFNNTFGDFEEVCTVFLEELRHSKMYFRFMSYSHFATKRYPKHILFQSRQPANRVLPSEGG